MRPFVFINAAVTADGKMDTYQRQGSSISSPADLQRVMQLRAEADAVMVGGRTLINEDPKLTVKPEALRLVRKANNLPENPMKVGITSRDLPNPAGDFISAGPARRVIFTTRRAAPSQIELLVQNGAEIFVQDANRVNLTKALDVLYSLGVQHLMVEGGGTLIFELLSQKLVDEIHLYLAPKIFGGKTAPTLADGSGLLETDALTLKLLDFQALDDTGGLLIRYQCNWQ